MRARKVLLIVAIFLIILLGYAFYFSENRKPINENSLYDEGKLSVSGIEEFKTTFESDNEQTYESFLDFPYDDMQFINEDNFIVIKEAYKNIEFLGKFDQGDLKVYDFYKQKYNQLLKKEVSFTDLTKRKFFLNEFSPVKIYDGKEDVYDVNNYIFYFFDMDMDGAPELCISDAVNFTYIFKYISDLDEMILWYEMDVTWFSLNGSKKISWNREGTSHGFYSLDENGDEEYSVFFFSKEDYNKITEQVENIYMVSLPKYTSNDKSIKITGEVKRQAYFDEGQDVYYFRVTEEQYNELTRDYFTAEELAEENLKRVTFTYDELFVQP